MENKRLLKTEANAGAGAGKCLALGFAMTRKLGGGARLRLGGQTVLSLLVSEDIYTREVHDTRLCLPKCRKRCPAQRGGYCEKSLTVAAAIVAHCMFPLPLGGLLQTNKGYEAY